MNLRNAVGIVLLAGGAGASYWWSRPPPAEPEARASAGAELPGYYLQGARLTATDEQGRVALRIHADDLAELPDDEQLALTGVRIEYTPADETPWSISSSRAIAPKDRSHVDLEGEVDVRSAPTDGSRPVQILAPALYFDPRASQVTTDGPVEIRVGDWRLTAVGLRALLNANKWELESNVHVLAARLLTLLPALAVSTTVAAQGAARCDAPIDIASDSFSLDDSNNKGLTHFVKPTITQCGLEIKADDALSTGVDFDVPSEWRFTGHVRITIAGNTMEAESAVFTFDKNQLSRAELTGAPAAFSSSRAEPGKEPVRGSANKISLDYVAQTLRMSENVVITRDRVRWQGCDVIYNVKTELVKSGDTDCGVDGFKIRIVPQPQTNAAPPAPP